jgi:hypothetical protein
LFAFSEEYDASVSREEETFRGFTQHPEYVSEIKRIQQNGSHCTDFDEI